MGGQVSWEKYSTICYFPVKLQASPVLGASPVARVRPDRPDSPG